MHIEPEQLEQIEQSLQTAKDALIAELVAALDAAAHWFDGSTLADVMSDPHTTHYEIGRARDTALAAIARAKEAT